MTLVPKDEMLSVITGVNYRLLTGAAEAFQYKWYVDMSVHNIICTYIHTCMHTYIHACIDTCLHTHMHACIHNTHTHTRGLDAERKVFTSFSGSRTPFPYLLVNIGSGVSIIRVDEGGGYRRYFCVSM